MLNAIYNFFYMMYFDAMFEMNGGTVDFYEFFRIANDANKFSITMVDVILPSIIAIVFIIVMYWIAKAFIRSKSIA